MKSNKSSMMGHLIYKKVKNKLREKIPLILIVLMIVTIPSYSVGIPTIFNIPPTWLNNILFLGESNLRHGDLLYTFKPTVVSGLFGDLPRFQLKATNMGNKTATFEWGGDWDPTVFLYAPVGIRVSTLNEHWMNYEILASKDLAPGESYSIEWTWSLDSIAIPPIIPGIYWTSASIWTGEGYYVGDTRYPIVIDTPGILTVVF